MQVVLDARLEVAVAVEAELAGEPHDRGRADLGGLGEIGDGAEPDRLRRAQDRLRHAPLGGGERRAVDPDPLGNFHGRITVLAGTRVVLRSHERRWCRPYLPDDAARPARAVVRE